MYYEQVQLSRAKQLPSRRLSRLGLVFVALGLNGVIFFVWQRHGNLLLVAPSRPPVVITPVQNSVPSPTTSVPVLSRAMPTSLRIDSIHVRSALQHVGLDKTGAIAVPTDYRQAGWYTGSPTPGEQGAAVLVGHVDNRQGLGVFWQLGKLKPGAMVQVGRADGTTARFRVDSVKQYQQDNFPAQEVYNKPPYGALRLITCSGTFNRKTHHYSHNTVIFARLIP